MNLSEIAHRLSLGLLKRKQTQEEELEDQFDQLHELHRLTSHAATLQGRIDDGAIIYQQIQNAAAAYNGPGFHQGIVRNFRGNAANGNFALQVFDQANRADFLRRNCKQILEAAQEEFITGPTKALEIFLAENAEAIAKGKEIADSYDPENPPRHKNNFPGTLV